MKKLKKKEKFPYHLLMLSVILLIFVIGLIWMLYRIKESPAEDVSEAVPEVKQTKIMDLTKGYDVSNIPFIGETVYDGTTQLTKEVFQIPFYYPFNDSLYVPNKEYVKSLTNDEIETIKNTAVSFVTKMLSGDSHSVGANYEAFVEELDTCAGGEEIIYNLDIPENRSFFEYLAEWYIDSGTSMEAEALTDKSMIFKNGQTVCRVLIKLTVNQISADTSLKKAMEEKPIIGKEIPVVVDVIFSNKNFTKVAGFRGYSEKMIKEIHQQNNQEDKER